MPGEVDSFNTHCSAVIAPAAANLMENLWTF